MTIAVSLCMIARNEALTLPRCLISVADLVDEMIIVDTGSEDRTRAVAEQALFVRLLENQSEDPLSVASSPGMRGHMARHNLARVYRAQGRAAEAEAQWKAALAERPESVRSLFELGLLYLEQNRLVETVRLVQQLTRLGSVGELAATMLRAETFVRQNDVAAARRLLETTIAAGPPTLEPRVMLSRLLLAHGADHEAAEKALRSVLALDPNHVEAQKQLRSIIGRDEIQLARTAPSESSSQSDAG